MSRTKNSINSMVTIFIYQVCVIASGFIIPSMVIENYGSQINGLVSSITQFISYFAVVEAGLSGALTFSLYKRLADKDISAINGAVSAGRKFYWQVGCIFSAITILCTFLYPSFIRVDALSSMEVGLLVLIIGSKSALEFFTVAKYRVLLTADQKSYAVYGAYTLYIVLYTICIVVMIRLNCGIVMVRLAAALTIIVKPIILSIYCKKQYKYLDLTVKPDNSAISKRWDALYQQLLGIVINSGSVVILTFFCDITLVSIYTVYNLVIHGINNLLNTIMNSVTAGFGDIIARKEKDKLQKAYQEFEASYIAMICLVYSVALVMYTPFMKIYTRNFTDANYINPTIALLFTINGFLFNIKTPLGMTIIAAGMYRETRWRASIQALILVAFGAVFAAMWGIEGVLIASIMSNAYRCVDMLYFVPKYITQSNRAATVKRWIYSSACMFVLYWISRFVKMNPKSYYEWVLLAAVTFVAALIIQIAVLYIADREQLYAVSRRLFAAARRGGRVRKNADC